MLFSGHLITFGQFLFISSERLINFDWSKGFKIPFWRHLQLVSLFVSVSVINNWSFSFAIPLTLHIVFRAGSLVSNCVLSRLLLKKQFSTNKYLSVFIITTGKMFCPIMNYHETLYFRNIYLHLYVCVGEEGGNRKHFVFKDSNRALCS